MLQCTVLGTIFLDEFGSYKQVETHSNCSQVKQGNYTVTYKFARSWFNIIKF